MRPAIVSLELKFIDEEDNAVSEMYLACGDIVCNVRLADFGMHRGKQALFMELQV